MIVSIVNQKGGVAKTTTSINLAAGLARHGLRTLLIDLDYAAGATSHFAMFYTPSIFDVLLGDASVHDAAHEVRPNLELVTSDTRMREAPLLLESRHERDFALRHALANHGYDAIVIDCPGGWSLLSNNAVLASTHYLIPVNSESTGLENAGETDRMVSEIAQRHHHPVQRIGILLTCWRATRHCELVAHRAQLTWSDDLLQTKIARAEHFNDLKEARQTVFDAPLSRSHRDYEALTAEVLQRWSRSNA